jgi:hypothetical protein
MNGLKVKFVDDHNKQILCDFNIELWALFIVNLWIAKSIIVTNTNLALSSHWPTQHWASGNIYWANSQHSSELLTANTVLSIDSQHSTEFPPTNTALSYLFAITAEGGPWK